MYNDNRKYRDYPYPNESKVSPGTGLVGSRVNEKNQKKMEKPNYE